MTKKIEINKDWLYNEFITNNKSYTDIARIIGCSRDTIKRNLHIFGFIKGVKQSTFVNPEDRFGLLTVIKEVDSINSFRRFLCKCDCGNESIVVKGDLLSGNTQSCGIGHKSLLVSYGEITGFRWKRIKYCAEIRGIPFNLTIEYAWNLYLKQNKKCALSGIEIYFSPTQNGKKTASLDRIDNSKGYVEGNVRWVHKDINRLRGIFDDDIFLEWCRKCFLYQYHTANQRPSFHEYFLMLAFDISLRSEDEFIRHGAIIIDNTSNHIIGTGYNATIRGSDKTQIDLSNRDARRAWMIHAEENAIMNCTKNPLDLPNGASIYITGQPCVNCLQRIVNFGIKNLYIAKRVGSITDDVETIHMKSKIIEMSQINITEIDLDNFWIKKVFYGA